jgi:hypothetical protein
LIHSVGSKQVSYFSNSEHLKDHDASLHVHELDDQNSLVAQGASPDHGTTDNTVVTEELDNGFNLAYSQISSAVHVRPPLKYEVHDFVLVPNTPTAETEYQTNVAQDESYQRTQYSEEDSQVSIMQNDEASILVHETPPNAEEAYPRSGRSPSSTSIWRF